jgi:hypothetical protein
LPTVRESRFASRIACTTDTENGRRMAAGGGGGMGSGTGIGGAGCSNADRRDSHALRRTSNGSKSPGISTLKLAGKRKTAACIVASRCGDRNLHIETISRRARIGAFGGRELLAATLALADAFADVAVTRLDLRILRQDAALETAAGRAGEALCERPPTRHRLPGQGVPRVSRAAGSARLGRCSTRPRWRRLSVPTSSPSARVRR